MIVTLLVVDVEGETLSHNIFVTWALNEAQALLWAMEIARKDYGLRVVGVLKVSPIGS